MGQQLGSSHGDTGFVYREGSFFFFLLHAVTHEGLIILM